MSIKKIELATVFPKLFEETIRSKQLKNTSAYKNYNTKLLIKDKKVKNVCVLTIQFQLKACEISFS